MADNKNNFEYPLPIGTVLKGGHLDYRVEQVLGQGGFGLTYKVSAKITVGHIKSSMMFAVKEHFVKGRCHRAADGITVEYSDEMSAEIENSMRSFVTEGRRLNNICKLNRNIVDVNEVFEANNTAYYVMEYLDGGDLRSLIRKNGGRLGETKALSIIRPIAEAVRQLHKERLLHLDIKPENIVMRKGESAGMDEPVLIDFGITKHFDTYGNITTTSLSTAYSEGYSPQEQYGRIVSFSPWVDVYSLAATLYYMLVGKDPVSAFDLRPEYLDESLPADISELTRNAITAGMAKDYMLRTQTVQAFIDSLEESTILSAGSILHGQDSMYRIQGLDEERGFCMVYKATVYSGGEQRGGNMTKTDVFTVYEYFVKGDNVKRLPNGHISGIRLEGEQYSRFMEMAKKHTGLEYVGQSIPLNASTGCEMFTANDTVYCVVNDRWKKRPSLQMPEINVGFTIENKRRIVLITVSAAVIAAIVWLAVSGTLGSLFSSGVDDTIAANDEALLLDKAIEDNDVEVLKRYAVLDSARAFLPLARYYMAEQPDTALLYAEKAVASCRATQADSTEAVTIRDGLLARITPAERTDIQQTQEILKETPAQEETQNNAPAKEETTVKPEPKITNEQRFKTAVAQKDVTTLVSLANSGYTQAYSKLASLYLERNNYDMADRYARRALNSGVGRQEAKLVVDVLDSYGYYDNGEHGGKPY